MLRTENDFYPQFVQEHVSVTVSASRCQRHGVSVMTSASRCQRYDVSVITSASRCQRHDVTVTVSASLVRGDTIALLEAVDPDVSSTCHGDINCPCARQAFAIEAGNTHGLFAIDGATGHVSAASDLARHDGHVFHLHVSVVNQGLDVRTPSDVRGPKNYGSLTIVIGTSGRQSEISDDDGDSVHIRHKRASVSLACVSFVCLLCSSLNSLMVTLKQHSNGPLCSR